MLDPVLNHWWIAPASLVLLFAVRALIVAAWGNHLKGDTIWFLVFNLVWVPYAIYLTLWDYADPEKIAADPDGWTYDMRVFWPYFALFYAGFAIWYFHGFFRRRAWWR